MLGTVGGRSGSTTIGKVTSVDSISKLDLSMVLLTCEPLKKGSRWNVERASSKMLRD